MMSKYCPNDITTSPVSDNQNLNGKSETACIAHPLNRPSIVDIVDPHSFVKRQQRQGSTTSSPPNSETFPMGNTLQTGTQSNPCLLNNYVFPLSAY